MSLDDQKLDKLIALIRDSFRVRPNQDPVYVDVGGHLARVASAQIQIVFGRRGSGKSCLLVHFHKKAREYDTFSVYVDADEVKTLSYPDLLIRLLISIMESLPGGRQRWYQKILRFTPSNAKHVKELRRLLDEAEEADVTESQGQTRSTSGDGSLTTPGDSAFRVAASRSEESRQERTSTFRAHKKETLERHLQDYKEALRGAVSKTKCQKTALIVDDFYLIHPSVQPDVLDYLHRLTRGTDSYLKIGTVKHRTRLVRYDGGQTIGVEPTQDVETIDLDQTFEDLDRTKSYLAQLLDSLGEQLGIDSVSNAYMSPEALSALTLASGGVPRDYLTTFVEAIEWARTHPRTVRVTPTAVYKGAHRVSYRTKLINLRSDAGPDAGRLEGVFQDLLKFCLKDKKKTAFLISQEDAVAKDAEHDYIKQLMDFKLIHVIEPDTSAASGRPGRYEAYTLDFALFMEPRRRNIDVIEFWRTDANRRREGLREAPDYPLERVEEVIRSPVEVETEQLVESIERETETAQQDQAP